MRELFGAGGTGIVIAAGVFYLGWQMLGRRLYHRAQLRAELRTYGLGRRRAA